MPPLLPARCSSRLSLAGIGAAVLLAAVLTGCAVPAHCGRQPAPAPGAESESEVAGRSAAACKQEALQRFELQPFTAAGITHLVLRPRPGSRYSHPAGPPVLILHEIPSLSAYTLDLAERVAAAGYDVYLPILWGQPGDDPAAPGVLLTSFAHAAVHPEFQAAMEGGLPRRPIVRWLAALCRQRLQPAHPQGEVLRVIGMCITGSFPLMLAAAVPELPVAPVVSQPALPLLPVTVGLREDFGLQAAEILAIRQRTDYRAGGFHILAFRFEDDCVSPAARLESIARTFPGHVTLHTLPASLYPARDGLPPHSHPVLTSGYVKPSRAHPHPLTHEAFLCLLRFLHSPSNQECPGLPARPQIPVAAKH